MSNPIKLGTLSLSIILLAGCIADDSGTDGASNEFTPIEFIITSEGSQTDVTGGQVLVAKNSDRFNEISLQIPSISGVQPNPNFDENEAVFLLTNISACSSLEITDISENEYTRLITATEVYSSNPGLCDPTIEAFQQLDYSVVEFERSGKPVSVLYKTRNDY